MTPAAVREIADIYPLTASQQGILAEVIASPVPPRYLQHQVIEVTGLTGAGPLREALADLTVRHDALRTGFSWDTADEPLAVVRTRAVPSVTLEDLRGTGEPEADARTGQILDEERETPFDLLRAPLLRVRAVRVRDAAWRLILTHHHLILDGWSVSLLLPELTELLAARCGSRPARLAPAWPFREFVTWQRKNRDEDADHAYLTGLLSDVTEATPVGCDLPPAGTSTAGASTAGASTAGASTALTSTAGASAAATGYRPVPGPEHPARAARTLGVLPATMVHAGWALLLSRWSGRRDVVFGTTVSGRSADLDAASQRVGMFLNTAAVRITVPAGSTVPGWLAEVQRRMDQLRLHEHAPLSQAARCSAVPPGQPLLSSVLAVQNYWQPGRGESSARTGPGAGTGTGAGAGAEIGLRVRSRSEHASVPVTVNVALPDEGVWVRIGYRPDQMPATAARAAVTELTDALQRLAAAGPDTTLAEVMAQLAPVPGPREEPEPAGTGGTGTGSGQAGSGGAGFGAGLIRERLRLVPGDVIRAVLPATDPVLPSVRAAADGAGCRLEVRDPWAGPDPAGGQATVLVTSAAGVTALLGETAPGARIALAGDPPSPGTVRAVLRSGRTAWRLWASGRTGGADACAELTRPAGALTLGRVPGGMAATPDGQPVLPGTAGELVIVRPQGPCRAGIRVRDTDGQGTLEQLGRAAAGDSAWVAHLLGLADGVAAAVVVAGSGGMTHAWLVPSPLALPLSAADLARTERAARDAALALPSRLRPDGYTVLPELPRDLDGTISEQALAAALAPPDLAPLEVAGEPDETSRRLAALPSGIRDAFIARVRDLAARPERHAAYWREALAGVTAASWPVPPVPDAQPAPVIPLTSATRDLPSGIREDTLITAAATALAMLTGTDEVLAGVAVPGGDRGSLPVRVLAGPGQPFAAAARAVAGTLAAAREHADVPWPVLAPLLPGPLAVSVACHDRPGMLTAHGDAAITMDLIPDQGDPAPGYLLTATAGPGRADPEDVRRLISLTAAVLRAGMAAPGRPVRAADLVSAPERARLLELGTGTSDGGPPAAVTEAILARCADSPAATAVTAPDGTLSYAELGRRARELAGRLRAAGIGREDRVAVCLPRESAMAWAPLGVMLAGAAYLPLDSEHPGDRLRLMLTDAQAVAVVTTGELADRFPEGLRLLTAGSGEPGEPGDDGATAPEPGSAAYVLYTSGSTGTPKGVVVEHRAVAGFARHIAAAYGIGPGTRLLAFAPLTFDVSVFELWAGLAAGATVVLAGAEERRSPAALQRLLESAEVTAAELPPSLMPLLDPGRLPALRLVSVGGEAPAGALVDTWASRDRQFWNGYGPTEATVAVTLMRCQPPSGGRIPPIGLPMPGHRAYVLDRSGRLVPAGVPGELCLAGPGLARGYLGRPGLTAASFAPDPHDPDGGRMYRTGDLVRWNPAGVLEFLGRVDRQVKIRGFRIEPGEVESALTAHPAVRQAVVRPWEAPDGTRHLAAYVVPAAGAEPPGLAELRAGAATRLPPYMLPTRLAVLAELPRTPSGKISTAALPEPEADTTPAGDTSGWSPLERVLADDVIGPLTGSSAPPREAGFFELGGNSLQAAQVTARVRERFGAEVSLVDFFREPTVTGLARLIETARPAATARSGGRYQMTGGATIPLSYPQAALYAGCRLTGDLPGYHAPLALRLRGPLDLEAVRGAFAVICARHAPLRVSITGAPGGPSQRVRPEPEFRYVVTDLPSAPPADRDTLLRRAVGAAAAEPFDLARDPLLRLDVHRLGAEDHVVQWTVHHLVTDGWSTGIQLHELGLAYTALAAGREPELAPLTADYGEFVSWQREYLDGPDFGRDISWWRGQLAGLPASQHITGPGTSGPGLSEPGGTGFRHGWRNLRLPEDAATRIGRFAREHDVTLFMTTLAAFAVVAGAETGSDDLLVLVPRALRVRAAWENLIGWFASPVPVRIRLAAGQAFGQLAAAVKEACTAALAHGQVPFETLRAELGLSPAQLTCQFSVQNAPTRPFSMPGLDIAVTGDDSGRDFTPIMEVYSPPGTRYQLSIVLRQRLGGVIAGGLEYDASLVTGPEAPDRWKSAFLATLAAGMARPGTPVSELIKQARR